VLFRSKKLPLGKTFFEQQVFEHVEIETNQDLIALSKSFRADLVVLDVLDTELELVQALRSRSCKVVSFEDLGEGASAADLVVSDIYPSPNAQKELLGIEHAILAPGFEVIERKAKIGPAVEHVLVLFGGTDPSELAKKSLTALELAGYKGKVSCVRGLGASDVNLEYDLDLEVLRDVKNIASLMASADLALSSAGRTITELASVGVPTICLAQNSKELSHTHAIKDHGVINLGLGQSVTPKALSEALAELIADQGMRQELSQSALSATAKRSNERVARAILEELFS
jgi:spore coat polysaccharide biosynthesis predicted glycosyltransferase SpsG